MARMMRPERKRKAAEARSLPINEILLLKSPEGSAQTSFAPFERFRRGFSSLWRAACRLPPFLRFPFDRHVVFLLRPRRATAISHNHPHLLG